MLARMRRIGNYRGTAHILALAVELGGHECQSGHVAARRARLSASIEMRKSMNLSSPFSRLPPMATSNVSEVLWGSTECGGSIALEKS
jgi:hypothetical protein